MSTEEHVTDTVIDEQEENYKAPPQKTIEELLTMDEEDESLRKYKEALLGSQGERASERERESCVLQNNVWPNMVITEKLHCKKY